MRLNSAFFAFLPVAICTVFLSGCGFIGDSFESASALDQAGKHTEAIEAYQNYLKRHPNTILASKIYYQIAKNYVEASDYNNAVEWYLKIVSEYSRADEDIHALLHLATLYHDKLKNTDTA